MSQETTKDGGPQGVQGEPQGVQGEPKAEKPAEDSLWLQIEKTLDARGYMYMGYDLFNNISSTLIHSLPNRRQYYANAHRYELAEKIYVHAKSLSGSKWEIDACERWLRVIREQMQKS
jgi:hypothetical protein